MPVNELFMRNSTAGKWEYFKTPLRSKLQHSVFCPFLGEIPCEYCCYITAARFNIESIWMVLMLLLTITKITRCSSIIDAYFANGWNKQRTFVRLTDFTPLQFRLSFSYYVINSDNLLNSRASFYKPHRLFHEIHLLPQILRRNEGKLC